MHTAGRAVQCTGTAAAHYTREVYGTHLAKFSWPTAAVTFAEYTVSAPSEPSSIGAVHQPRVVQVVPLSEVSTKRLCFFDRQDRT